MHNYFFLINFCGNFLFSNWIWYDDTDVWWFCVNGIDGVSSTELMVFHQRNLWCFAQTDAVPIGNAVISVLVALIMYPLCFSGELSLGNRPIWEFGWAYGVCWGAAIFLFGGVILLLCDKESEEIYFKERKIVHNTQLQT